MISVADSRICSNTDSVWQKQTQKCWFGLKSWEILSASEGKTCARPATFRLYCFFPLPVGIVWAHKLGYRSYMTFSSPAIFWGGFFWFRNRLEMCKLWGDNNGETGGTLYVPPRTTRVRAESCYRGRQRRHDTTSPWENNAQYARLYFRVSSFWLICGGALKIELAYQSVVARSAAPGATCFHDEGTAYPARLRPGRHGKCSPTLKPLLL